MAEYCFSSQTLRRYTMVEKSYYRACHHQSRVCEHIAEWQPFQHVKNEVVFIANRLTTLFKTDKASVCYGVCIENFFIN